MRYGKKFFLEELIRIDLVLIGKDTDEVDQNEDYADAEAERKNDLQNTLLGLTQHKVVDAKAAEEEADQRDNDLILTVQIFAVCTVAGCLFECYAAVQANICIFLSCVAAVRTELVAGADVDTAVQADCLIVVQLCATVFTEHRKNPHKKYYQT